ncbi:hypothetical protein BB561_003124 [Smittium simulii]|uniref:Kinesin motor domain-containing protein n=1 Tax=Smittium simulii TaxID=133385 RepID=A0A2T9YMV3_9FUNG|nr:hypothetical protein BB561_003124 [Smittium simulii]
MPPDTLNFCPDNNTELDTYNPSCIKSHSLNTNEKAVVSAVRKTGLHNSTGSINSTNSISNNSSVVNSDDSKLDANSSCLLVAIRVRPFNTNELKNMIPTELERYGYSFENNQENVDTAEPEAEWGKSPVWKAVHVLDSHVLVFDPPEEDNSFGSSANSNSSKPQPRSHRLKNTTSAPIASHNQRHKDIRFVYDKIYGEDSTQKELYEGTTQGLIRSVFEGYNGSVFAYGATGCGKTYTISGTPDDPGIIFLTMKELFEKVEQEKETKEIDIRLSYLEVYNETIRDLISPDNKNSAGLSLREDVKNGVSVAGLSEHKPTTVNDVMDFVIKGNTNRTVGSTAANNTSSRSHAVLQINVKQKPKSGGLKTDVISATMSIIDLAGSERATVTRNKGERMREGANINRSLLSLANCINALCDPKKKRHIPYRDSKLTRLLKFSLGGNCRTVMITCISPASTYYEETLNTLKYASRAKNIKTTLNKNSSSSQVHIAQYTKKIQEQSTEIIRLQKEIFELKKKNSSGSFNTSKYSLAEQKSNSTFNGLNRTAQESRRTVAAEQTVQDIRNRISQNTASSGTAEYDYASAFVLNKLFLESQCQLKAWRERFDNSNVNYNLLNNLGSQNDTFKKKVEDLLSNLAKQSKLASRHTDHAKNAIQRHKYAAEKCANSSNPSQALSNEQKQRIDQELKILQLTSEKKGLQRQVDLLNTVVDGYANESLNLFSLNATCLSSLKSVINTFKNSIENATISDPSIKNVVMESIEYLNSLYLSTINTFSLTTSRIESNINSVLNSGGPSNVDTSLLFKAQKAFKSPTNNSNAINVSSAPDINSSQVKSNTEVLNIPPVNNNIRAHRTMSRKELLSCATNNMRLARLVSPRARKSRASIVGSGYGMKSLFRSDNKPNTALNTQTSNISTTLKNDDSKSNNVTYLSALTKNNPLRRRSSIISTISDDPEYKPSPRKKIKLNSSIDINNMSTSSLAGKDGIKKVGLVADKHKRYKRYSVGVNDVSSIGAMNNIRSDNLNSSKINSRRESVYNNKLNNDSKSQNVNFSDTNSVKLISPDAIKNKSPVIVTEGKYVPPVANALPKKSILKTNNTATSNSSVLKQAHKKTTNFSNIEPIAVNSNNVNFRSSLARDIKIKSNTEVLNIPPVNNNIRAHRTMSRKELLSCATNNMRLARLVSPRARKSRASIVGSGYGMKSLFRSDNKPNTALNTQTSNISTTLKNDDSKSNNVTYLSALTKNNPLRRRSSIISTISDDPEYKPSPRKKIKLNSSIDINNMSTSSLAGKDGIKKVGLVADKHKRYKRYSVGVNDVSSIGAMNNIRSDNLNSSKINSRRESVYNNKLNNDSKSQNVNFSDTNSVKLISPDAIKNKSPVIVTEGKYVPPVANALPKKSILKTNNTATSNSSVLKQAHKKTTNFSNIEPIAVNSNNVNFRSSLARDIKSIIKESLASSPPIEKNN